MTETTKKTIAFDTPCISTCMKCTMISVSEFAGKVLFQCRAYDEEREKEQDRINKMLRQSIGAKPVEARAPQTIAIMEVINNKSVAIEEGKSFKIPSSCPYRLEQIVSNQKGI